jgi:SHO1 osmosensor
MFLIIGVMYTLATDSVAMNRYQITAFGSVAIVFAVFGVNQSIFSGLGALDAIAAGWLILAMVDILWVLYFTSEDDSLTLHIFNAMGTGGLSSPSRRRRTIRAQPSGHNMAGNGGYATNYGSGGGIGSHDAVPYDGKMMSSPIGGGAGIRSQNSFAGGQSMEGGAPRSIGAGTAPGSIGAPMGETRSIGGGDVGPGSPLMGGGNAGVGAGGGPGAGAADSNPESYSYKAKALYACESIIDRCRISGSDLSFSDTASPDDPNEISFTKGEVLDIVDKQGKWWQARKADGTIGSAYFAALLYNRVLIYLVTISCTVELPPNHLMHFIRATFFLPLLSNLFKAFMNGIYVQ